MTLPVYNISPTLNHLKIIALATMFYQYLPHFKRGLRFKMKLARSKLFDLSRWQPLIYQLHRLLLFEQISFFARTETDSFQKFEQNFRICSWRRWNLKWCRILCLLPYRPRQAKQRLASEFSSFPVLFSHFLPFSKQRLSCKFYLRQSCAVFGNSRLKAVEDKLVAKSWMKTGFEPVFIHLSFPRLNAQKVGFGIYSVQNRPWIHIQRYMNTHNWPYLILYTFPLFSRIKCAKYTLLQIYPFADPVSWGPWSGLEGHWLQHRQWGEDW